MRRRAPRRAERPCLTVGCGAAIPHWKLICDDCLRRLPWPRRRALLDAPAHQRFDRGREAAAWLAAHPAGEATARMMGEADG